MGQPVLLDAVPREAHGCFSSFETTLFPERHMVVFLLLKLVWAFFFWHSCQRVHTDSRVLVPVDEHSSWTLAPLCQPSLLLFGGEAGV